MSSHYNTEPAATASATIHTTLGPIHISLFATQTPLTCRNFLQHIQDSYYTGTIFHRLVPNFILQGGDPTGTGSGGTSIYETPEFEYDAQARDPSEKVVLRDELHSRLKFNRRGLVGMAKAEDGSYGSQFFITLGDVSRELNGQCTMFGRVEGDSIYTVLRIAEGEVVEGTERLVYPVSVTGCEVGELGPLEGRVVKRAVTATVAGAGAGEKRGEKDKAKEKARKKKNAKGAKTLLSFGEDGEEEEEGEEMPVRAAKPKYNAALVTDAGATSKAKAEAEMHGEAKAEAKSKPISKRPRSPSPVPPPRKDSIQSHPDPDPATQLPLPDPESPSRSPPQQTRLSRTNAEIESIKASMRRTVTTDHHDNHKKSALESMIPSTAIRGRRRPAPGSSTKNGTTGFSSSGSSSETAALKLFNAFKAKLENADSQAPSTTTPSTNTHANTIHKHADKDKANEDEDEESHLCDLHFIANCQSCQSWDDTDPTGTDTAAGTGTGTGADETDHGWLTHQLRFGKDTLGKDLNWKKENPDDVDSLMVIDPREKEREITGGGSGSGSGKRRGLERERERERKRGRVGDLEWRK
ncbi:cyclophilin-like protein [Aspergillus heteromorphus CBS 117.55]|uniref:Peptidyl-prolyl isomerase CWC27 n=1 Tax=Aspergillus heteromorphus CBS 117.55 TaxID=1448321 RepID=A0A317X5N6_9EURO|nr:cyclophilin-like protein [Aspergillus heteromorphus CBS 117.55]PWY92248.1 cyclophilin-like protein [Aspergillus heteromorphus CBS 117.55]